MFAENVRVADGGVSGTFGQVRKAISRATGEARGKVGVPTTDWFTQLPNAATKFVCFLVTKGWNLVLVAN